jgi:cobyrinic acid a,c-diamide synthase
MNCGRIVISALRGGSGKTILSIGIIAALRQKGFSVAPFKKGPDYIDAGWLAHAAGRACFNLDTFIIPEDRILHSFFSHTSPEDIAVIEGNRGLYDCIDIHGKTSTAELAKLVGAPVVLTVDCSKTTRTVAAVIQGLMNFDRDVAIGGIVLNRVAGPRHERIITDSIRHHCNIRVLGAIPKIREEIFPERHMGLVPTPEHGWAKTAIEKAADIAGRYIDLDTIVSLSKQSSSGQDTAVSLHQPTETETGKPLPDMGNSRPCIGIIRDSAFQFYYPENIDALKDAGARIVFISPLSTESFPDVDALYIGGGFPETHAGELAENITFKSRLKQTANAGLPVYAECGGLMYLGDSLVIDSVNYPMAGVLPVVFGLSKRPQGHGYTVVSVEKPNPFLKVGTQFKGHEFHYSKVLEWRGTNDQLVFNMKRGAGFISGKDGVCHNNVLATYTHIHALGLPEWAESMVSNAAAFMKKKKGQPAG